MALALFLNVSKAHPDTPSADVEGDAAPYLRVEPSYPPQALRDGIEGYVELEMLIGTDGSILHARIAKSSPGCIFVENTLRAVRLWKFKPRVIDGVVVSRWAETKIVFQLNDQRSLDIEKPAATDGDKTVEIPITEDLPLEEAVPILRVEPRPLLAKLFFVAGIIVFAGALGSCASTQPLESWAVLPESPCSSLEAAIPVPRSTLQTIVGPNFAPAEFKDQRMGQLRFRVYACADAMISGRSSVIGGFGVVTVPLAKENAAVEIAGIGAGGWTSLALYVGPKAGRLRRLMANSAFAALEGEASLSSQPAVGGERVTANIAFANGELKVAAVFQCEPIPFRHMHIAVGTGTERYSLLFGEISGRQCSSSDVSLELIGDTPFSDLGLMAEGATAVHATGVGWHYQSLQNAGF